MEPCFCGLYYVNRALTNSMSARIENICFANTGVGVLLTLNINFSLVQNDEGHFLTFVVHLYFMIFLNLN